MQVVDKRIEGRWEKIEQRNIATEDAQSMAARDELVQQSRRDHINAEGRWGPISRELKIGDIVQVSRRFVADDQSMAVSVTEEAPAMVTSVDTDGDAFVHFAYLTELQDKDRWIWTHNYGNLLVRLDSSTNVLSTGCWMC